jgi:hypothetical protein
LNLKQEEVLVKKKGNQVEIEPGSYKTDDHCGKTFKRIKQLQSHKQQAHKTASMTRTAYLVIHYKNHKEISGMD